ncbi:hypothetical protein [Croceicoccus naphthovorans]|uniref:Uncharacterized protein n=1 Tax=Croceicoccus naphthovorans TaxID=1348774 RepID=A0A0G3XJ75_9SPHN|nr:hypothetical protein [Croceicoccus naphthovorans]AKM10666.1 hypothetical protein AB433_12935 [Croceicoccus naphthovorans]MBB3988902.1 phosphoglycerol transferase MdoB-like AlkP superfamily enzyme [Croceicoccus naphthovorans]
MTTTRIKAPTTFWIVAVLSLLWNAFGAYDYLMTQLQNREYLGSMGQGFGLNADQMIAYYAAMPWWGSVFWALGVWGSVAGSVLLLLRSRFAMHAFIVSLLGLVVTLILGFVEPIPGQTDMTLPIIFSIILLAVLLALISYSRRMIARRVIA